MSNQTRSEIVILNSATEIAEEAARRFDRLARESVEQAGRFTIALAGGETPRALYNRLTDEPYAAGLPWPQIYWFFGDERCVPPDHPDSNYRMAQQTLFDKLASKIPSGNIRRIRGELEPEAAAASYAEELKNFFGLASAGGPSPENFPVFDLVLLGMGPDGHTASLFPGTPALQERGHPVVANFVPKLDAYRITLTAPAINRAANIIFMVEGQRKAEALRQVLEGEYQPQLYPSQLVRPVQGHLTFLVDQAAAALLKHTF